MRTPQKPVSAVCPICRQELTLETFEEDFVPPRRFGVSVARVPAHPLPLIAVCDALLGILCPTSNCTVYVRCDGEHVSPACMDPSCRL